jgi:hypothetical protein
MDHNSGELRQTGGKAARSNTARRSHLTLLGLVVLSAGCSVLVNFAVRAYNWPDSDGAAGSRPKLEAPGPASPIGTATSTAVPAPNQRIEVEVVVLTPDGFQPAAITRAKGQFILVAHHRSGLSQADLRLDRDTGAHIDQASVPRERAQWSNMYDLPPGKYLLTEATHPGWTCTITINP